MYNFEFSQWLSKDWNTYTFQGFKLDIGYPIKIGHGIVNYLVNVFWKHIKMNSVKKIFYISNHAIDYQIIS